ncbi:hypothetical protein ABW19_dt0201982 [Dactylella cylindrospora]|nr:hypothetical protein ABW19_dt0201982 [Dactylella cylindrospora]
MESELWPQLDDLEDSIDTISVTLKPLLEENLPKNASLLPLVDKAKLYILATYAIESLIFSYLETNSITTSNHPIMKELTRIRQYFQKIRDIETKDKEKAEKEASSANTKHVDTRDNLVLDKEAAGRFISAALAGNDKYDVERAENIRLQKERAHIKFQELGEGVKDPVGQRAAETTDDDSEQGGVKLVTGDTEDEKSGQGDTSGIDEEERKRRKKEKKKRKREAEGQENEVSENSKKTKKDKKKEKKKEQKKKKK